MLKDILETVQFLKDEMVPRREFDEKISDLRSNLVTHRELERVLDDRIGTLKSDLMTHMDGFIGLHQKLDLELVALRAKYDRLESYITQLAKHANVTLQ